MNLLRGLLVILWKAFLVTLTLGLTCGLAVNLGLPSWLFGLMMIPAAVLFCHLSDTPRPGWWRILGLGALAAGAMFLNAGVFSDASPEVRSLVFSILVMIPALYLWRTVPGQESQTATKAFRG